MPVLSYIHCKVLHIENVFTISSSWPFKHFNILKQNILKGKCKNLHVGSVVTHRDMGSFPVDPLQLLFWAPLGTFIDYLTPKFAHFGTFRTLATCRTKSSTTHQRCWAAYRVLRLYKNSWGVSGLQLPSKECDLKFNTPKLLSTHFSSYISRTTSNFGGHGSN